MIAPGVARYFAELLAASGTGVSALTPLVPRAVTDPEPPQVDIYNAIDDAWVARKSTNGEATPQAWTLVVRVGEEMQIAGDPGSGTMEDQCLVIVELQGVTDEQANDAVTLATAFRVMRAVRRVLYTASIGLLMQELSIEGQRFTLPAELQGFTSEPKPGAGAISIALAIPLTLTDTWALGAEETP